MSKKSKKAAQNRKPVPARQASSTAPKPAPSKARSRPGRETTQVNLLAVRIVAGFVGAICLVGLISVLATVQAPYPTATIIELVLLALIIGFCIFTAILPQIPVKWVSSIAR